MAILTVTLNPALDLETRIEEMQRSEKLRCAEPRRDPGGGGINVARAIALIGGQATAALAAGGGLGQDLIAEVSAAGVAVAPLPAPGETRQNLSVIEESSGAQYRFIFPGPTWSDEDITAAEAALLPHITPGDLVVLSGSLPPGLSASAYVHLAKAIVAAGGAVVADTSGEALRHLASATIGLKVLRMDGAEARELTGEDLPSATDSARVARELVANGAAEIAILARGAEGSVLASADGCWFAPAADVPVVSRTGAGDSFVAAMTLALSRGLDLPDVLVWGVCAASAAVTTEATRLCDRATFEALKAGCQAKKI